MIDELCTVCGVTSDQAWPRYGHTFFDGDVVCSDCLWDAEDAEDYSRDPYAYYGLSRGDF